jgi:hypothetical protein
MKYCYDNGTTINPLAVINSFAKYYDKKNKNFHRVSPSMSPSLLDNYIILITGMFESQCQELQEKMNAMERTEYFMYIASMKSKFAKCRQAVYSRLAELESLRKTMVRAQQINQSQINKLQKENYKIRSEMKTDNVLETPESRERRIVIDRNMRAIAFAKRSSREITRTLAIKNIDPTKEKLQEALEKFVLFSEMMREKYVALIERGVCKL